MSIKPGVPSDSALEPEPAAQRQCGRCRAFFPAASGQHPMALREWWVCADCRGSLFDQPGARSARPRRRMGRMP